MSWVTGCPAGFRVLGRLIVAQLPLTVNPSQSKLVSPPHAGAPARFQHAPAAETEISWKRHPEARQITQAAPFAATALTMELQALEAFGFAPARQDCPPHPALGLKFGSPQPPPTETRALPHSVGGGEPGPS